MSVLVDTSIWSQALRRRAPNASVATALGELLTVGQLRIIGPIRQELLSGIAEAAQFKLLRERLAAFPDLPVMAAHFELAAEFSNRCRAHGVQGSQVDFLICAVAVHQRLAIWTADGDFAHYARVLPLRFYPPAIARSRP